MEVLDSRKKLFLSLIFLLGILISSHYYYHSGIRVNSGVDSDRSFLPNTIHNPENIEKNFIPVINFYPIHTSQDNLQPLALGIQDIWKSWIRQSPSVVLVEDSSSQLPNFTAFHMKKISRRLGADFLYSAEIFSKNGRVYLQPLIYDTNENTVLKSKAMEIHEELLADILNKGINHLFTLTERNLKHRGIKYSIDRGLYFQELYMPATDSLNRYFYNLNQLHSGRKIDYSEWEDLARRETLFWNPYEYFIREKYKGKEDAYETKYFLENFAKRSTPYFRANIARIALDYGKILLDRQDRYKTLGMLQLADSLFQSSKNTLSISYAENLSYMAKHYAGEKNWELSRLHLLNSQAILLRLNQTGNPIYIQNKFLLSKIYRVNSQINLGILELEDALGIAQEEWKSNPDEYLIYLAMSYFNLGTMYLESDRPREAYERFIKVENILRSKPLIYSDLMFYSVVNRGASLILQGKWNEFIHLGLDLNKDIRIIGLEGSEPDSKNSFNLALAYQSKGALDTSGGFNAYYRKITSYSKLKNIASDSRPEYYSMIMDYQKPREWIFSEQEEKLISSFTGKFRMENHADEIRSRTYTDRLEDHDIFLGELFGKLQPTTTEMVVLRKQFGVNREYKTGRNVIFVDIGPAIANSVHPAVTSMSLVENFPDMEMVLMDLPSEVDIFMKKTDPKLREELLNHRNIRILAGDGVLPLKTYFRKEGAWILQERGIPQVSNRMIVIRAANSIDVYEPYSRVRPFLESLANDFYKENLILFFNRLIIAKPKNSSQFQVIGSQSIRGFYHNIQSLDRQGQPPFILSGIALGEGE